MIAKAITFCGQLAVVCCDARCDKAWGRNRRPTVQLSDDEDDFAWLADSELGIAPDDPGTYEGGEAKPRTPEERLNKWCVRECERCNMSNAGQAYELLEGKDWSDRRYNIPRKTETPQPCGS